MTYSLEMKIDILDRLSKGEKQTHLANEYGCTRRSIINWKEDEEAIRAEWDAKQNTRELVVLAEEQESAISMQKKKDYLRRLEDLGSLAERKQVLTSGIEKIMFDHLEALDQQGYDDIKADVRVKMLKDLNDLREQLSGDPLVLKEMRMKWQYVVLSVIKMMIPDRLDEFLARVKDMEEEYA